jgi:hypothetical protein
VVNFGRDANGLAMMILSSDDQEPYSIDVRALHPRVPRAPVWFEPPGGSLRVSCVDEDGEQTDTVLKTMD